VTEQWSGLEDIKSEYFAVIFLALFSPLAWVREIEFFKIGFIFGFAMIIITLLTIAAFCVSKNSLRDGEATVTERGYVPVGDGVWATVGFSFYMYEGIGGLMPLMTAAKDKESFPTVVMMAMGALSLMHITFSSYCYYTFGDGLDKPIIMEMMPQSNIII
jgi:amino acid permease